MRKIPRIILICRYCKKDYEVICTRQDSKFCSRLCYHESTRNRKAWNGGKTYEELYGEKRAIELKKQVGHPGELNGRCGKPTSKETRKKQSKAKKGVIPWNKGKKFPGLLASQNRAGPQNAYVKHILKTDSITYEEYLSRIPDRTLYYREVNKITNLQPFHLLENFNKRGKTGQDGAYHLDHKYPISKGYEHGIPPEVIGDLSNLQMIPWRENVIKSNKLL